MRPDEHKKKKNAAYKKKHGIGQNKTGQSDDKSSQKKGEQSRNNAQKKDTSRQIRDNKVSGAEKERAQVPSSSSDSEAEEARQPRKTFQRRQIVSNWQKYDFQPENDEKQEARGESFEKLLSMSGDAVAHFRFKDELEWDDVAVPADSKIIDDPYSQYLNIDAQKIGQAMNCLPLYKVLGLDPELFPAAEVELMEATAAENRQRLLPEQSDPSTSMSLFSSNNNTIGADQECLSKDALHQSVDSSTEVKQPPGTSLRLSSSTSASHPERVSPDDKDRTVTSSAPSSAAPKLALQDEDLDSLLDLDTPEVTIAENVSKLNLHSKESIISSTTVKSQGADSVSTTSSQGTPVSPNSHKSEEKPKKDGVDLEDWLDSILDD